MRFSTTGKRTPGGMPSRFTSLLSCIRAFVAGSETREGSSDDTGRSFRSGFSCASARETLFPCHCTREEAWVSISAVLMPPVVS